MSSVFTNFFTLFSGYNFIKYINSERKTHHMILKGLSYVDENFQLKKGDIET